MSILSSPISGKQSESKLKLYEQLALQLSSLLAGERDLIANAANFASLIFHALPDLNWAGCYFLKNGELVQLFERKDLEGRPPAMIAQALTEAFSMHCTKIEAANN